MTQSSSAARSTAIWLLCALLITTNSVASSGLVQVDGRFYPLDVSATISFDTSARIVLLPGTTMSNCRRPSGSPPAVSSLAIVYGSNFGVLYSGVDLKFSQTSPQVRIQTPTGDVVCSGEVAALPQVLFQSGFE